MQRARETLGKVCAKCDKTCRKLVVDHDVKPFVQILDEFLREMGLTLEELKIRGSRSGFKLRKLGRKWRKFHDKHATLVGICAKCNGSLNSRGYRLKKKENTAQPVAKAQPEDEPTA
jgi:hypothetical protein